MKTTGSGFYVAQLRRKKEVPRLRKMLTTYTEI
jgi:hypothetical protein